MRDRHLQEVRYSQLSRSYVRGHVTSRVRRRCLGLSPFHTLCFQAGFVVCSPWYTDETWSLLCILRLSHPDCVPGCANGSNVFTTYLSISSELPWTTTSQDHWTCLFQAEAPDILQERWVKHTLRLLALHGGSVILFAQQLVYHHLSGEWCCVILLVEHTNCEGPKHFTFIISNPQSMLTR